MSRQAEQQSGRQTMTPENVGLVAERLSPEQR